MHWRSVTLEYGDGHDHVLQGFLLRYGAFRNLHSCSEAAEGVLKRTDLPLAGLLLY